MIRTTQLHKHNVNDSSDKSLSIHDIHDFKEIDFKLSDYVLSLIGFESEPLQHILKRSDYLNHQQIRRTINKLTKQGYLEKHKIDGLIWVRKTATAGNRALLDKDKSKFQTSNGGHITDFEPHISYYRNFCITEAKKMSYLDPNVKEKWTYRFGYYLYETLNSYAIMQPKDFLGEVVKIPLTNRFTSQKYKIEQLEKYNKLWDSATSKYKYAVFLTLTLDPKLNDNKNLWNANKTFSQKLNKFYSFLKRRLKLKERPVYICNYEFQKNGRLHAHIIFFGRRFLMAQKELSRLWNKYGGGSIVFMLSIKNNNGAWEWIHNKPNDARNQKPKNYLKKYIEKNLYNPEACLEYWVYNTRFFTYSRRLLKIISYKIPKNLYVFVGVEKNEIISFFEFVMYCYTLEDVLDVGIL